jgi:hypothetical protein
MTRILYLLLPVIAVLGVVWACGAVLQPGFASNSEEAPQDRVGPGLIGEILHFSPPASAAQFRSGE